MRTTDIQPPGGMFSRIMSRLGLERQLQIVKRHLGLFIVLALLCCVLAVFAYTGLRHVMASSSFGPYISLAFSDPGVMFKNSGTFAQSVGESIPGASLAPFLLSVGLLMLFARLIALDSVKYSSLEVSIQKHKHGHS